MPCWERRTQTVSLMKADLDLLATALKADGWVVTQGTKTLHAGSTNRGTLGYANGKLTHTGTTSLDSSDITNGVKRAYTAAAYKRVTAKAGFTVTEKASNVLVATRRRY